MATRTKKAAKKVAKKTAGNTARKTAKKAAKKTAPGLKQLMARTRKIRDELTEILVLMGKMGGNDISVGTSLESGGSKDTKPLATADASTEPG